MCFLNMELQTSEHADAIRRDFHPEPYDSEGSYSEKTHCKDAHNQRQTVSILFSSHSLQSRLTELLENAKPSGTALGVTLNFLLGWEDCLGLKKFGVNRAVLLKP